MPINLCYTKRVRGFQQVSDKYTGDTATFLLRCPRQRRQRCGSTAVATPLRRRDIRDEPIGCWTSVLIRKTQKSQQF